jgi:hypothetical protein
MNNVFSKQVQLNQKEVVDGLFKSEQFHKEVLPSYGGQLTMRTSINRVYLKKLKDDLLEFSENGGYSGMFEVIGKCWIEKLGSHSTLINLQFQYGKFQPQMILNFLLVLTTIGGVLMLFNLVLGAFFIAIAIFPFSILLGKKMIVKLFLKKISEALNIDQKWNKGATDSMYWRLINKCSSKPNLKH